MSLPAGNPWRSPRRWLWPALGLTALAALFLPPVKRKVYNLIDRLREERIVIKKQIEKQIVEKIVEKRVEVPVPAPGPPVPADPPVTGTRKDLGMLLGGIQVESSLLPSPGGRASSERLSAASYAIEFNFKLKIPRPATTFAEFAGLNPELPALIPSFQDLLKKGKVSGFYQFQYEQKQASLKAGLLRLDRILTRHNFYDLESAMELENPATRQKALLLQGEMDVVSDGSDGDRMESFDNAIFQSQNFQPTTSYAWEKVTTRPNPVLPRFEEELKTLREKLKAGGLSASAKASLTERSKEVTRILADLKRRSFLIGQEDPFIVIPLSFRQYRASPGHSPGIGDFVVVICGNKMMPAIVGDYGPAVKSGEASLRIAQEIDPKCSPYNRPVSDLRVTYLIFPDSAAKSPSAPDYAAWHLRCGELLTRLGGDAARLHQWEDRLKKPLPGLTPAATDPALPAPAVAAPVPGAPIVDPVKPQTPP